MKAYNYDVRTTDDGLRIRLGVIRDGTMDTVTWDLTVAELEDLLADLRGTLDDYFPRKEDDHVGRCNTYG